MPVIAFGKIEDVGRRVGVSLTILATGALAGPPISGAINNATGGFKAVGYYAGMCSIHFSGRISNRRVMRRIHDHIISASYDSFSSDTLEVEVTRDILTERQYRCPRIRLFLYHAIDFLLSISIITSQKPNTVYNSIALNTPQPLGLGSGSR
jgi:hypothetical protein